LLVVLIMVPDVFGNCRKKNVCRLKTPRRIMVSSRIGSAHMATKLRSKR
jgi:hypothetical protein